jgi:hypothetical protein
MTGARQIAANQRNARKSTGPRSGAGKRRTSRNSYRHGLTATTAISAVRAKRIEKLACKIAGNAKDAITREWARTAAQAEFDLAQIRLVKVTLIERMVRGLEGPQGRRVDAAETMPSAEAGARSAETDRLAEAVRRALPELVKLDRYERRAAALRDQGLRALKSGICGA